MFQSLQSHRPAWYSVLYIACYLVIFMLLVSGIIFLLRGPLRKHKQYDLRVFQFLQPLHKPANHRMMQAITFFGKHQFLIPANLVLIAIFFFISSRRWYAFDILVLSLSSLLMMLLLKQLFRRKRPEAPLLFAAKGMSFPSGHAMMSLCFYGFLLHLFFQYNSGTSVQLIASISCVLLIGLIGFSRVYLQVHYVSDVLAGFIIGGGWLCLVIQIFNKLQHVI